MELAQFAIPRYRCCPTYHTLFCTNQSACFTAWNSKRKSGQPLKPAPLDMGVCKLVKYRTTTYDAIVLLVMISNQVCRGSFLVSMHSTLNGGISITLKHGRRDKTSRTLCQWFNGIDQEVSHPHSIDPRLASDRNHISTTFSLDVLLILSMIANFIAFSASAPSSGLDGG